MGNKSSRAGRGSNSSRPQSVNAESIVPLKSVFDDFESLMTQGKLPELKPHEFETALTILKGALRQFDVEGKEQALHLACEKIGDSRFIYLVASFVTVLESVASVRISSAPSSKHLAHCAISVLSLRDNQLTSSSAEQIAVMIRSEALIPLVALDLSMNLIDDEGGVTIIKAMQQNTVLKMLDLSVNKLANQTLNVVSELLQCNNNLLSLNLTGNFADERGITQVIGGLESNTTITDLRLDFQCCSTPALSHRSRHITERNQIIRDIIKEVLNFTPKREFKKKMDNMKGSYRSQANMQVIQQSAGQNSGASSSQTPSPLAQSKSSGTLEVEKTDKPSSSADNRRFSRHMSFFGNFSQLPLHKLMQSQAQGSTRAQQSSESQKIIRPSSRFDVGVADMKGRRPTMEDCAVVHGQFRDQADEEYYGVFDGHGGRDASEFVACNLHQTFAVALNMENDIITSLNLAFERLNGEMLHWCVHMGTTAAVVYIKGNIIYSANVGDTRVVYVRKGLATRLSVDHRPDYAEEIQRISSLGGHVRDGRVCGILAGDGLVFIDFCEYLWRPF
eukprot:TRINITY_DN1541_c1_g1_i2.p1 TRINITY_DN1541_c1_g1~~TRINITY_DN1541_c1_g1_i2.p1  ORF type:complete len:573 (-),score=119.91 TRINITY_DN1541_c1_g1_i2:425-2110(-)